MESGDCKPIEQIDVSKRIYCSILNHEKTHDIEEDLDYALYKIDKNRTPLKTINGRVRVIYSNCNQIAGLFIQKILMRLETNIKKKKLYRRAIEYKAIWQGGLPAVLLRKVSESILKEEVENVSNTFKKQGYLYGRIKIK